MPIDIVTVSFRDELHLLKLQARSFRVNLNPDDVGDILVIINDNDVDGFVEHFKREVAPEYGVHFINHLKLIPHSEIMDAALETPGWRTQQTLKLLAARNVRSSYYLILDTKNHFVKKTRLADFFSTTGLPLTYESPIGGTLEKYFRPSMEYFDVEADAHLAAAMPAVTPYVIETSLALELLKAVEMKSGVDFATFFHRKNRLVTEFFLYYAFLAAVPERRARYQSAEPHAVTLFGIWPETEEKFRWAMSQIVRPSIRMFGLHRNRWDKLTESQRGQIASLWAGASLFDDVVGAEAFLRTKTMQPSSLADAEVEPAGSSSEVKLTSSATMPRTAQLHGQPKTETNHAMDDIKKTLETIQKRMDQIQLSLDAESLGADRVLTINYADELIKFYLPYAPHDVVQREILRRRTFFEAGILARVAPRLAKDAVIVDAGANIGNHSIFFAKVCQAARVVAFEPLRTVFPILTQNVFLNGLSERVECVNAALGSRAGTMVMDQFRPWNSGATSFRETEGAPGSQEYPVQALDQRQFSRLDLIKIDVEGSQMQVLQGARNTIERLRPEVMIEMRPALGEVEGPDKFLQQLGYAPPLTLSPTDFLYVPGS